MRRRATATTSAFWPPSIRGTDIPHRSLVALGLVAACFCFFSLAQVITMLVITRILLQFFLQQAGVMLLRVQRPELERPFRMPLYPLPPLVAMAGFMFMLSIHRAHALKGWPLLACGPRASRLWNADLPGPRPPARANGRSRAGLLSASRFIPGTGCIQSALIL